MLGTYNTTVLKGLINNIEKETHYFTKLLGGGGNLFFDTEEIAFDKMFKGRKTLAPYVSPMVAGVVQAKRAYETMSLKVPYIKILDQVTPKDGVRRSAGEGFTGTKTPDQRVKALRVELITDHRHMIDRRIEEQWSQLIQYGTIDCVGKGFPHSQVDYGLSANNLITLAGGVSWNTLNKETQGQIVLDDMKNFAERSVGTALVCTMEQSAWEHFSQFDAVIKLLDKNIRLVTESKLELAPIVTDDTVEYKGNVGNIDIYVYKGFYENDAGVDTPYMDVGRVIFTPKAVKGVTAFGAIYDLEQGMQPVKQFTKNWYIPHPSAENILTQSAPLCALPNIDLIVSCMVLS